MALFADLLDLVLPDVCLCCGRPSADQWCPACREPADVRRCEWQGDAGPPVPVWAAADYEGAVRQALLAYKEQGQRRLAGTLAQLLAAAVRAAAGPAVAGPILIAPVPSAPAAARERGGDHMLRLAKAVCRLPEIRAAGALELAPVLRFRGRSADAAGLTRAQRADRAAPLVALPPTGPRGPAELVIVDDIATTGSTIAACAQVLRASGWQVRGAAVVAHTRRRWG